METLALFDRKDYDASLPRLVRESVRAIIRKGNRAALLYSGKYGAYTFPGGSIERGETHLQALIREVGEETGLRVIPGSARPYGAVTEIRKDIYVQGIFEQRDHYYLCEVEDRAGRPHLSEGERQAKFSLAWIALEEATRVNQADMRRGRDWWERETFVMRRLLENSHL